MMAPNYFQLLEIAPKIRDIVTSESMCSPEEVHVEFSIGHDDLQKINKFFYEKMNNEPAPADLKEVNAMNVKLCDIKFTYKEKEDEQI